MKFNDTVLMHLNQVLSNEMIAINQYFLHAKLAQHWGYDKLSNKIRADSIDEMKHADQLIDRILFLGGTPILQADRLSVGKTIGTIFKQDLDLEKKAIADLQEGIAYAESVADYGTRQLLQSIYDSEEQHVDWLETQIGLIDQIGLENYLQSQI